VSLGGRVYVGAVCLAALVAILFPYAPHSLELEVVLSLTLLSVAVERVNVAVISRHRAGVAMGMALPINIAAALVAGPREAAIIGALGGFSTALQASWVKRAFNAAAMTLSSFAAAETISIAGYGHLKFIADGFRPTVVLAVLAAGVVHCIVNGGLLVGILWIAERVPPLRVIRTALLPTAPGYLGYSLLGLLMGVLWQSMGALSAALVVLPLIVARWAISQYTAEQAAYEATVRALVQAVETKDLYTRGHSERVATASVMIARVLGMRDERVNALRYAGVLHDVGKLGVPTKILHKTSGLTPDEYAAIQVHPVRGTEMLQGIEFLDEAFQGILHHHERMDGFGYPMGLAGPSIPEFARVIAVADAFDSMTSTRSYRGARSADDAVAELERCKGSQFDPVMVEALVKALRQQTWNPAPTYTDPRSNDALDDDDPTLLALRTRHSALQDASVARSDDDDDALESAR
jgi:HD domain